MTLTRSPPFLPFKSVDVLLAFLPPAFGAADARALMRIPREREITSERQVRAAAMWERPIVFILVSILFRHRRGGHCTRSYKTLRVAVPLARPMPGTSLL